MKIFKTDKGIVIEKQNSYFIAADMDWDSFINDDQLHKKIANLIPSLPAIQEGSFSMQAPVGRQELWACGVTYYRSMIGRQEESRDAGGGDFYSRVYDAERPEVFFKSTPQRIVGPGGAVRIRKDSSWDVPEPELTLVVSSSGKIVGYTIGNDMSSRSIEGENPLYLPQAKTYDGCAAIGPCVYVPGKPLDPGTMISLTIVRNDIPVFSGNVSLSQMKRSPEELVSFVYRECSFPSGCLIMTGTGIVPGNDFTLQSGDRIVIGIDQIGELVNIVA
jgi:2-dehydro-3-deoxy-D-arabinonate dehydratase